MLFRSARGEREREIGAGDFHSQMRLYGSLFAGGEVKIKINSAVIKALE